MIAFLTDTPPPPRNHTKAIELLGTANVRLREAVDWLTRQQESFDRHLVEDYHHLATNDLADAIDMLERVVFVLRHSG